MKCSKNRTCLGCDSYLKYCELYDAFYCQFCDSWKEKKCDDPECLMKCYERPDKPSEVIPLSDEIINWGRCLLLHKKTPIMIGDEIKHICKECSGNSTTIEST
jgi:hypothetical protein